MDKRQYGAVALVLCCVLGLTGCTQTESVYQPAVAKLIEKADSLKKAGQTDAAICRLEAAADIAPETYPVHYNLGVLYTEANRWQQAEEHLEKALTISPNQPNVLYTLGYTYQNLGDSYFYAASVTHPKELQSPETPPEIKGIAKPEALAKGKEAYNKAISTYEAFLKAAPANDPGRKEVEAELTLLQGGV